MTALVHTTAASEALGAREASGWRAGRPVEDPNKVKRWGFITAQPSEYLIHVRRGRVTTRSGQGATCFKWPWDSVAIVPTSLQRLSFRADQVTAEKVGVEVVGFAAYRIADPNLAFRVLNFSFPERAQEKLEQTLTAMFVGGTRRLVANLTVEECLRKRKSALAEELLREVAPVVGGWGRAEDHADQGWGIVIDTIEIQEVRVLSEAVFRAMQAPYRAALDQQAREAKAQADKDIAEKQAECERDIEQARIVAAEAVRQRRVAAERDAAELDAAQAMRRAELQAERRRAELEAEQAVQSTELETRQAGQRAELEADFALRRQQAQMDRQQAEGETQLQIRRAELGAEAARAALAAHEPQAEWEERRGALARVDAALQAELRKLVAEVDLAEGQVSAQVALQHAEAALRSAEADAKLLTAQKLPELAAAIGSRISEVKVAQYGSGEQPLVQLAGALRSFVDVLGDR